MTSTPIASTSARALGRTATTALTAIVTGLLLALLGAAPAMAHAALVSSSPPDRAELDAVPDRVELTFNEPVELPTGGLRVFDAAAARVDAGSVDTGDPETVAVTLPVGLPDGGYVVTYRVTSADSHPVAGVLTFTIGDAEEVEDALVAELFGGAGSGRTGVLGPALRGVGYIATLLAVGALAFALLVARRSEDRERANQLAIRAAVAGAALALAGVPVQAAAVGGTGLWEAVVSPPALAEVMTSGFGHSTLLRVVGLLALAALWRSPQPRVVPVVAAAAVLASHLLDGHQRTVEPTWLLVGGDAIHLAVAALWFGGVVLLAHAVRRRSIDDDPVAAARLVARFSNVALVSVGLLVAAGFAMAWPLVGTPRTLVTTAYGWTLVAKVTVVVAALAVSAYNRQRLLPAIVARVAPAGGGVDAAPEAERRRATRSQAAWRQLSGTLRAEAALLAVVLVITGVLVAQQPAAEDAGLAGQYEATAALGDDLQLDLVVAPNRAGRNTLHVYVLDDTGRPAAGVENLRFELTYRAQDIGPIRIEPHFAGPGHWIATIDDLRFPGDWDVRVAGVDRFREVAATVTVPVAQ